MKSRPDQRDAFQRLAAAIEVGVQEFERGEEIPWTPTLMATLRREAEEEERLRLPFDDDAYLVNMDMRGQVDSPVVRE